MESAPHYYTFPGLDEPRLEENLKHCLETGGVSLGAVHIDAASIDIFKSRDEVRHDVVGERTAHILCVTVSGTPREFLLVGCVFITGEMVAHMRIACRKGEFFGEVILEPSVGTSCEGSGQLVIMY